jgi:hypothetical protein
MKKTILATSIILATYFTTASESFASDLNVNGFASLRGGQMIDVDGVNPNIPNLYNDDNFNFKDESLFGLQVSSDLGEGLSATIQFVAQGINDFNVEARWAYLAYEINDNHTVKVGRMANPLFYQSEYELVGYTHNFARLPKSVYYGFDFSTIEGASIDSNYFLGDYFLTTKFIYGNWEGDIDVNGQDIASELTTALGVNASINKDWLTVFGGALTAEFATDTDRDVIAPLVAGGVAFSGAEQGDIDNFFSAIGQDGKDGVYFYAGFKADYNDWLVDYEMAQYEIKDSSDAKNKSWFLALGHRFNDYTVTVVHEDFSQNVDYSPLDLVENPILQATGRAVFDSLGERNMTINSLNVRWDFHSSAALKADYFVGSDDRATVGDFSGFSVGVDFIF